MREGMLQLVTRQHLNGASPLAFRHLWPTLTSNILCSMCQCMYPLPEIKCTIAFPDVLVIPMASSRSNSLARSVVEIEVIASKCLAKVLLMVLQYTRARGYKLSTNFTASLPIHQETAVPQSATVNRCLEGMLKWCAPMHTWPGGISKWSGSEAILAIL